ncbi:hypothetical protein ACHHYP_02916 [Achlya hypogyna]|uniref:Uncharacterized protein n=1 Tax=Achlya hypogyna TaxID=1202772 RepID=A0A1V9Z5K4_ACHHY|nr:hypothetical protein ACHHYP_02916 [Achlya hypogyna]
MASTKQRTADAALECQYSYKPCSNPRSTKRNGSLHLLCEFHRKKANAIQQVYTNKKRAERLGLAYKASDQIARQPPALRPATLEPAAAPALDLDTLNFLNDLLRGEDWVPWTADLALTQEERNCLRMRTTEMARSKKQSSAKQAPSTQPPLQECQYSYKPCTNPRSTKRNGSLHLLCEYHRKKANAIQRAYANKKRLERVTETEEKAPSAADPAPVLPMLDDAMERRLELPPLVLREPPPPDYPMWDYLGQVLFET